MKPTPVTQIKQIYIQNNWFSDEIDGLPNMVYRVFQNYNICVMVHGIVDNFGNLVEFREGERW